ncbi:MAG: flagellar basal body-associated FliL family protein [Motiliproteus sp.]|nr:flagellar basal body-associated FliL family protein [Motiliproteus sp.]MCW9052016.1 flagellar basal body-associated FliL family protein [Motiliproteus sp.]
MAEEAAESEGKKSSKLVMILIILIAVLLLAVGGGAAWYFFLREDPAATQTVEAEPKKKEAIYVKVRTMGGKPYFIANFSSDKFGAQRFLQIFVEARTRDQGVADALKKHMPLVVHSLTTLFSTQTLADMQTAEGKERLRQEATDKIKEIMQNEIGEPGIEEVYFTNFVMQ